MIPLHTNPCLPARWTILLGRLGWAVCCLLLSVSCSHTVAVDAAESNAATAEEQVTFYLTYGYQVDGDWIIPLRIWVHEGPDLKRRTLAKVGRAVIAKRADLEALSDAQKQLFDVRTSGFVADSESRELVRFVFDGDPEHREFVLTDGGQPIATDFNGLAEGTLKLDRETAAGLMQAQGASDGWLRFRVVSEDHAGIGWVRLIPAKGHSVISDIDDTVKITGIPDGESVVLRNTFFREFVAAPCMAELYRHFGDDVAFHYVSGGPWQMYEPLQHFLFADAVGFPSGSFHMKNVRTNPFEKESYQDFWTLIANGSGQATFDQKLRQIRTILQHFPGRTFTLIGDSGERDPEVFRQIREEFPEQVREIMIRVVTDPNGDDPGRLKGMKRIPANPGADESCHHLLDGLPRQL